MAEPMIYKAMLGVMADIGAIGKDQTNQGGYNGKGAYKFRGIDQLYNALQPALIKNGVIPCPCVTREEREQKPSSKGGVLLYSRLTVNYKFYAQDGSFIECTVVGEAMDSGDKATNKALTAAYKYACYQVFCIPTEEMIDSERDTYEVGATVEPAQTGAAQAAKLPSAHINALLDLAARKGYTEQALKEWLSISDLRNMTMETYKFAMDSLETVPDTGSEEE